MSPRLRAWVTQVLDKAGVSTGGRRQKAQAVLDAFRKKVPYIADPVMGEFMATPEQSLCLDEGGLCFVGGDCDDHSIGLAAAMMSIGIPAMIIGASYRDPIDVPTHVFMAFQDDFKDWVRMDGTTKQAVGRVSPSRKEFWVEPGATAKDSGEGDFVGMSGASSGMLAAPVSLSDLRYPGIR
jgi:transglutaminase-like putative cysteine protease